MGLPFSTIIQNGQEYDVTVPAPSSYAITASTRVSDIQTLIKNSVAKGFIPYVARKSGNNISVLHLVSFYENDDVTFTQCSGGQYGSITGVIEDAVIVLKLHITTSAITYDGYGVNKSASIHNTLDVSGLTLYYK